MTSRAEPMATEPAEGGAKDALVPVVPKRTAAPMTSRTPRRASWAEAAKRWVTTSAPYYVDAHSSRGRAKNYRSGEAHGAAKWV